MPTIAVDFDGVIHAYSRGWADGSIYDEPLPGAVDGIRALMDSYAVFVHTTREPEQVVSWLVEWGFDATDDDRCGCCDGEGTWPDRDGDRPIRCASCEGSGRLIFWNAEDRILVTNRKLPALLYVDDRALRFESWTQALDEISAQCGGVGQEST